MGPPVSICIKSNWLLSLISLGCLSSDEEAHARRLGDELQELRPESLSSMSGLASHSSAAGPGSTEPIAPCPSLLPRSLKIIFLLLELDGTPPPRKMARRWAVGTAVSSITRRPEPEREPLPSRILCRRRAKPSSPTSISHLPSRALHRRRAKPSSPNVDALSLP